MIQRIVESHQSNYCQTVHGLTRSDRVYFYADYGLMMMDVTFVPIIEFYFSSAVSQLFTLHRDSLRG